METNFDNIPLFPLSVFLLPGEQTHLHIFEPRYRQLVTEINQNNQLFGIPYFKKGNHKLGSLVKLVEIVKDYPSGEKDILIECVDILRLKKYHKKTTHKSYPSGQVEVVKSYQTWLAERPVMREFMKLQKAFDQRVDPNMEPAPVLSILSFLNLTSEDKYKFLKSDDSKKQEDQLLNMIKFTRLIMQQERRKEFNFYMN